MSQEKLDAAGQEVTGYFDALAEVYSRHRPSYPAAAIEAMVEGLAKPIRAADIGCGTGIATRLVAATRASVSGIDPSEEMLAAARRVGSSGAPIEYCLGTGEQTGLSDGSMDLVLCAQAFHWFEPEQALREFHRILRPEGRLALIWNVRQDADAFSTTYNALMHDAQAEAKDRGRLVRRHRSADATAGGWFANPRTLEFDNPHRFDWASLLGRARSASYWPREQSRRVVFEKSLRRAFDEAGRNGEVVLAQTTKVTLADRA